MEPLNSNGLLKAIGSADNNVIDSSDAIIKSKKHNQAIIATEENDNVLMIFNGDYTIENVCFDCRNVQLGIWCKRGTVTLKNCHLINDSKSSTSRGISIAGIWQSEVFYSWIFSKILFYLDGAKCILENTIVQDFADGIICAADSSLVLKDSQIKNCEIGLVVNDKTRIENSSSAIINSSTYGIFYKTNVANVFSGEEKKRQFAHLSEIKILLE